MERYTGLRCGEKKKTILELSYWFESGKQKKKKRFEPQPLKRLKKKKRTWHGKKENGWGYQKEKKNNLVAVVF